MSSIPHLVPVAPSTPDFNTLCTPLRPALLARARQLCRDRAAAEDLVQDTLLHALEVWGTFAPEGRPAERASAWLHQMLMNLFRDRYRIGIRRAEIADAYRDEITQATMAGADGAVFQYGPHPTGNGRESTREHAIVSRVAPTQQIDPVIEGAMAQLDKNQREVVLRFADGESYKDIAAAVGVDLGTVRSRLHRARRRLVTILEPALEPAA